MTNMKDKIYSYSFIITILVTGAKFIGIIRDALIAMNFGLSYMNDVYMFCLGTTMLLISLGYGLTTTLIPIHTDIIENKSLEYRNNFSNNIITITFLFSSIIVLVGIISAKEIIQTFAPILSENPKVLEEAVVLLRTMFLSILFVGIQSVISAINQCHKEFIESTSMSIFANIVYIIYLMFFIDDYGLKGFGVATVIGFFIMLLINVPKYIKLGYRYRFYIDLKDSNIKKLVSLILPIMLSSSLIQINLFIIRAFAGRLEYGSISSLDYGNKINMMVYEIFAVAINMAIYPVLATFISNKDMEGFKEAVIKGMNMIFIIMIPSAVGLLILREEIITVYLKRGAFGENEVRMTSNILIFYIPSMVGYGIRELLNRAFYSLGKGKEPTYNSIINIILNFVLALILVNALKAEGLALTNSLAVLLSNGILYMQLRKAMGKTSAKDNHFMSFIKIVTASSMMGIIVYLLRSAFIAFINISLLSQVVLIIISVIIGVLTYLFALYILKVEELDIFLKRFTKNK